MSGWKLEHPDFDDELVRSRDQLVKALDRFISHRQEKPFVVHLTGPPGSIAFGVGRADTFLSHTAADIKPPYRMSRGSNPPGGRVIYFQDHQWTPIASEAMITWSVAKRAILDYFEKGKLSSSVEWEGV